MLAEVVLTQFCILLLNLAFKPLLRGKHLVEEFVFELRHFSSRYRYLILANFLQCLGNLAIDLSQDLECLGGLFRFDFVTERTYLFLDDFRAAQSIFLRLIGLFTLECLHLVVKVELQPVCLLCDGVVHFQARIRHNLVSNLSQDCVGGLRDYLDEPLIVHILHLFKARIDISARNIPKLVVLVLLAGHLDGLL